METLLKQLTSGNALLFIFVLGIGGSFQNGFHVTGISSPSPYIQHFINSSWYERYEEPPPPQTVTLIWSAIISLYAAGGLCGALCVKFMAGTLGRKRAMIGNNFISITAAVIMLTSKSANSFEMIILARFLFGVAAGLGGSIHAIYLGESSPKHIRGMVTLTSSTFLSIGKLSGQILGLSEILGREDMWNILLSVPACFSVVQLLLLPFFPEAPRYSLIDKGDAEACKNALQTLWGKGEYKQEMEEMVAEQAAIKGVRPKSLLELLRDRNVRWQLITMFVIYSSIQFSGIPAISVFSFDIFLKAGIPREKIRYVTVSIGASEILTSLTCLLMIERIGRRPLLWGGFGSMSATLVFITITLNLKDSSYWVPYMTVALIIIFVIFSSGGPMGTMSSVTHEIFIQCYRPAAFIFTGIQRWMGFALVGLIFPFLIDALQSNCFVLFACVCLWGSLYTFFFMPETKGKTLLEISEDFKAITVCGKSFSEEKSVETKL
ncbi:solute carrier family 2 member 9, like 1 [Centroberyx affinis]|uniref:solute carrier family 2 member 9, like 1 n=1 Tax=Centroberyx affinis TaxID=166261 RepID=UPI003A5BCDCD